MTIKEELEDMFDGKYGVVIGAALSKVEEVIDSFDKGFYSPELKMYFPLMINKEELKSELGLK